MEIDMSDKYDAIETMDEIEWLQNRPETYIGTTNHPTHLFEEVFDNALDEVLNGADKVTIKIEKDGTCIISDVGRGFPVGCDEHGVPYPVKSCTKLYTSGKFNKKVKAYKVSAGLNGIGLVAVAGLSDTFNIISHRDGKAYEYNFTTDFNLHKINYTIKDPIPSNNLGTIISFKPSSKIFRSTEFDIAYIKERVRLVSILTSATVELYIHDVLVSMDLDRSKFLEMFFEDAEEQSSYSFKLKEQDQIFNVTFYFDFERNEPRIKGSVNLLPIHDGTHVKYFKDLFSEILMDYMPKNKILVKGDYLIGLRCFIENTIQAPRFSGQTKLKLDTDIKKYDIFTNSFKVALNNLLKTEIDTNALYQRFIDYKQGLSIKKTTKKLKKRKFSASLLDCLKEGPGTALYIVEGESAAGSLKKCRDKNHHAIFTLFGKSMPNVDTAPKPKLLANKTITDLFSVLGKDHDVNPASDSSGIKYEKIQITTDPDIDGFHIALMVMKFFNKFFPKLIEEKRVLLPQIPLYGYYEGNKFTPVYDLAAANKLMAGGKKLMRHKGLGEFDPDELEIVLFKKSAHVVITKEYIKEAMLSENIKEAEVINVEEAIEETTVDDEPSIPSMPDMPNLDDFIF